ncbi:polyphosphate kinase [Bacteroidota bacterium]|nr:polyphosphate kinase [Bacteroidota bacterium]
MKLFDRDFSWLSYNSRVMQEAADENNVEAERLKFISIADSNLKVFIRERFFALLNTSEKNSEEKIYKLNKKISKQFSECGEILNGIFTSLKNSEAEIFSIEELDEMQLKFLNEWFRLKMKPDLHPKFLTIENEVTAFEIGRLYLFVQLIFHDEKGQALIEIPLSKSERFVEIPSLNEKLIFVLAETVIRYFLPEIFPGHEIPDNYLFEMIAGNEFYSADEEPALSKKLENENQAIGNYFLFEKNTPKEIIKTLLQKTKGSKNAVAKKNSILALNDFIDLGKLLPLKMKEPPITVANHPLENIPSILEAVSLNEQLLYFPYHSFSTIINLLKQAATSSSVKNIFITLYRTAPYSLLAENLLFAAANGKNVFAYLEIKASESEEENIMLANKLEEGGVKVSRNFPGLKIHAKTILIEEETDGALKRTALLNTGNFNEKTADKYTDIAILSSNKIITQDVSDFFEAIQIRSIKNFHPKTISFSPNNYRQTFSSEIQKCIEAAKQNISARIILKVNNLEDEKIIPELYEAADAGVKIEIIVRSICCMKPKDNIEIISIVDRFLEHARIFSFRYGEEETMYTTSADLMTRNLDRRMEFLLPIKNQVHRKQLSEILQLQLRDNVKARIIDKKQKNKFLKAENGEAEIRSQDVLSEYFSPPVN